MHFDIFRKIRRVKTQSNNIFGVEVLGKTGNEQ